MRIGIEGIERGKDRMENMKLGTERERRGKRVGLSCEEKRKKTEKKGRKEQEGWIKESPRWNRK